MTSLYYSCVMTKRPLSQDMEDDASTVPPDDDLTLPRAAVNKMIKVQHPPTPPNTPKTPNTPNTAPPTPPNTPPTHPQHTPNTPSTPPIMFYPAMPPITPLIREHQKVILCVWAKSAVFRALHFFFFCFSDRIIVTLGSHW